MSRSTFYGNRPGCESRVDLRPPTLEQFVARGRAADSAVHEGAQLASFKVICPRYVTVFLQGQAGHAGGQIFMVVT